MPEHLSKNLINWASILEDSTRDQAVMSATMPFIYPHIALMPDAHLGKGATVGSVIPTLEAIIPAAVGVDIGCGMIAVRTQWPEAEFRAAGSLTALREAIEAAIPLSAGVYNTALRPSAQQRVAALEKMAYDQRVPVERFSSNWRLQLGSLGSGNHFIEVSVDEEDMVWLFLHSGSRGVGNKIAQHHIRVAAALMKKFWITLPDPDLAYLPESTDEFWEYMRALMWAQEFATQNREEMMDRVILAVQDHMDETMVASEWVNCHHNYTAKEKHFGKDVWVSRKGAINAEEGVMGLIPGSMGAASYVVEGKGNRLSLNSSPHGAGRNHSRSAARKLFTGDMLREAMVGIEYRDTDAFIDEHPLAYKDIDTVMHDAQDLVKVKHRLHQIVNVKGD